MYYYVSTRSMGHQTFGILTHSHWFVWTHIFLIRRLRFSSDADIVRLTNARIIIIIIIMGYHAKFGPPRTNSYIRGKKW